MSRPDKTGRGGEVPFDISVQAPDWQPFMAEIRAQIAPALRALCAASGAAQTGELSLAFVSDQQIELLNKTYRGKDGPTNVLSFPAISPDIEKDTGGETLMGDVVIALETCARQAGEKNISLQSHVLHMIIHGVLHLQGFDHIKQSEAEIMEGLEIRALAQLGIANPYEIVPT